MKKSDLMTIKEFAQCVGVKQSVLRYYDDIGLFRPTKYGESGYRYYSPFQITAFNMVSVLCGLRTKLKEIGDLQRNRTPETILEHLEKQEEKFDSEMHRLQESYAIAHAYRWMIKEALAVDENIVTERYMPEKPIFIGPETQFEETTNFFDDFLMFYKYSRSKSINLSYPVGAMFNDMDTFKLRPSMPNHFYSTDPRGSVKKEEGRYLIAYTRGYYGKTNDIPEKMAEYTADHGLDFDGPVYSLYLLDEVSVLDPDQYLAQICVRVTKKRRRNRH